MGHLKMRELLAGYWLRRWTLLALLAAVGAVGTAVVLALPRQYQATVSVAARAEHPSGDLVLPAVSILPEDRLKALHAELLAEPLLARVVDELKLFPEEKTETGKVAELRSHLEIQVEGDDVFSLTATADRADTAAAIANRLAALYADEVKAQRLEDARRVESVFAPEIETLRKQLSDQDGAIARFKAAHAGTLPEELDGNLRAYDRVSLLRERDVESQMEAQRRKAALLQDGHDDATALGRLRRQREELTKQLTEARSQWTDEHPEVQRLLRQVDLTDGELKSAEAQAISGQSELRSVERQLQDLTADEARLGGQAQGYQDRVGKAPAAADGLSRLVRARDALQAKYQALLGRQVEAELSADLEQSQGTDLFRIVSPALAPSRPAKPDRRTGLLLAWLTALVVAGFAGAALELSDDSIRGARDARERLGVPVLAIVPSFPKANASGGR